MKPHDVVRRRIALSAIVAGFFTGTGAFLTWVWIQAL